MASYVNFYENHDEAVRRLRGTVVTYDGEPFYILAICAHNKDGIFRIYLQPLGLDPTVPQKIPSAHHDYPPNHASLGPTLDAWMDNPLNKGHPIIRKMMNSPKFNKFRPFPLGMCNSNGRCYFLERQPLRPKVEQGLIRSMVTEKQVTLADIIDTKGKRTAPPEGGLCDVDMMSEPFRSCVVGDYPNPDECLKVMKDVEGFINEAVAFHREFAFVRGPINMVFLAYKSDIIGVLPKLDFSLLRIGRKFGYTLEVVKELGLFQQIIATR